MAETVHVPGGRSLRGTDTPIIAVDGEGPLQRTIVKAFRMDVATVTNRRFARFVENTGYVTEAENLGDSLVFEALLSKEVPPTKAVAAAPWWRQVQGACWHRPLGPFCDEDTDPEHPVVHVTWNDAVAFARWAGGRLPAETEWEHAARGGLGDVRYPWGNQDPDDIEFLPCNIWQGEFPRLNTIADGFMGTAPARSFQPNGFGLFNMVGNVWQWTKDPFKVRSLKKSVIAFHARKTGFKLSKGGSFLCHASYCFRYRIAARTGTSPDSSMSHMGFRLVYPAEHTL
ncbi:MAG: formylglycine-generating enzyme family protein [Rhodobacteraceae bacterium]|nr:formylglycine-generating enzyme family protein [Paracoccaceae bacterium]